ncbi:hypothetical protein [Paraglaciecola hydrolytica]|uniref:Uncharacterized protein n=1 Tax=Paraglaciecola hydrolytica TaxID=1799789 RepID=A0A136A1H5_9ALTE|nr:hypothetical protein [Paraglaciecola hydrolytica]KXI29085.1 hypothetical protein AX660_13050 [Paraglaciecola hydrolytica]
MKNILVLLLVFLVTSFAITAHASQFKKTQVISSITVLMVYSPQKTADIILSVEVPLQIKPNLMSFANNIGGTNNDNRLSNNDNSTANYPVPTTNPLNYSSLDYPSLTLPQNVLNVSGKNPQQVMF